MTYTILSASYANTERTAAIIMTLEAGAVLTSELDRPDQWVAMLQWGTPDDYTDPPSPSPDRVTSRQFFLQLEVAGLLDQVEAWIDTQPLPTQIAFERSSTFVRDDEMLQQGFAALGFTTEQVDGFFTAAAGL